MIRTVKEYPSLFSIGRRKQSVSIVTLKTKIIANKTSQSEMNDYDKQIRKGMTASMRQDRIIDILVRYRVSNLN